MAKNDNHFGGETLPEHEKSVLVNIDAKRVHAFMDTLRDLLVLRRLGDAEIEDISMSYEMPLSGHEKANLHEVLRTGAPKELLWGGMTIGGLGVAFLGKVPDQYERKPIGIGVIADPQNKKIKLLPASMWEGTAEDGYDSGMTQHAYRATDPIINTSAFKPIDEWGVSRHRGNYAVSLFYDPHFLHNSELQRADVLFQKVGNSHPIQATVGHTLVRADDINGRFRAYNFERQITEIDVVESMHFGVLTSYSSGGS